MTIRFENSIVATLGQNNQVLWNATVVTEGELVAAVGDAAEMKERYPDAEVVDCSGKPLPENQPPILLKSLNAYGGNLTRRFPMKISLSPRKSP